VSRRSFDALVERAQRFVEAVIRITKFRRDEDVRAAEHRVADALLFSIHGRGVDQAIAFVDRHLDHPLRLIRRRLKDPEAELRHGRTVVKGDNRLGFTGHRHSPSLAKRIVGGRGLFEPSPERAADLAPAEVFRKRAPVGSINSPWVEGPAYGRHFGPRQPRSTTATPGRKGDQIAIRRHI
jgi:hypothetical protein